VRGAYNACGRGPETRREGRDAGRRKDTEIYGVGSAARSAGTQGAGEHLSREARIASDEDPASEHPGGGEAKAQGVLGQQSLVGDPAHPIGAERYGPSLQSASLAMQG
jgi:hypothetical protein